MEFSCFRAEKESPGATKAVCWRPDMDVFTHDDIICDENHVLYIDSCYTSPELVRQVANSVGQFMGAIGADHSGWLAGAAVMSPRRGKKLPCLLHWSSSKFRH
jgi:hypothetical protein